MKLIRFEQRGGYVFSLTFANGTVVETDLAPLIAEHVAATDLATAQIDQEWGCLQFNDGKIDIEPQTLYRWAESHHLCHH